MMMPTTTAASRTLARKAATQLRAMSTTNSFAFYPGKTQTTATTTTIGDSFAFYPSFGIQQQQPQTLTTTSTTNSNTIKKVMIDPRTIGQPKPIVAESTRTVRVASKPSVWSDAKVAHM